MKSNFFNIWREASEFFSAAVTQTAFAVTSPSAAPFGLEIGVSTRDAARARLGEFHETKLVQSRFRSPYAVALLPTTDRGVNHAQTKQIA